MTDIRFTTYITRASLLLPVIVTILLATACNKKETITPDEKQPPFYQLPQGNNAFDPSIQDFYNKYGAYILYKFAPGDYTWNLTGILNYYATQGNQTNMQASLDFLFQKNLDLYPVDFLKKTMPFKIILAGSQYAYNPKAGGGYDTVWTAPLFVTGGYNFVTLAITDTISTIAQAPLSLVKGNFNYQYWRRAIAAGGLEIGAGFAPLTNYSAFALTNYKDLGLLADRTLAATYNWNAQEDFYYYIREITAKTTAQFASTYLIPAFDTKGNVQKKYDYIINYYKTKYGVDLQAIADVQ